MAGRILAFVGTTILGVVEQFDYLRGAKKHPLLERVKWVGTQGDNQESVRSL